MTAEPEISVIICTRNRGSQLRATLNSLCKQDFQGAWELVLVDNGSTDDTPQVIEAFSLECPFLMRVIYEPVPGLSRARNRGLANARGAIVAFTDDDCYPETDYLTAIQNCFHEKNMDFFGGRVLLFDSTDRRITIKELNARETVAPCSFIPSGMIHGANMAFRKAALLEINGFDERLGAGTRFKSGEDTDAIRRLSWTGKQGAYDPRICVYHHHGRKTEEAERKLTQGYYRGRGSCMMKYILNKKTRTVYLRRWYWHLRTCGWDQAMREILAGLQFLLIYGPQIWNHPYQSLQANGSLKRIVILEN